MKLHPFQLERFFARHEFSAKWLLSCSDCEPLGMRELLALADPETRGLWETLRLSYTEARGLPLLRREIAKLQGGISPDEVLEVVPEEGIFLAMMALLEQGDHVVAPSPAYQSLHAVAEALGCEVTFWRPHEERGWRFEPEDLRAALRPETRLVVWNFPHNPTGFLPDRATFEEMIGIVRERGIALVADEMYRGLELDGTPRLPSAVEVYDRALVLGGMSKAYGLPGLRVGWLATRDHRLLERLAELKDYTTICASAPSEILALVALRARDWILARNVATIRRNLAALDRFFAAHPAAFAWQRPRAGSVGLARLRIGGAQAFCERLVREASVMLAPSSLFGHGDEHVRFGLGRADLPDVLGKLSSWLVRQRL